MSDRSVYGEAGAEGSAGFDVERAARVLADRITGNDANLASLAECVCRHREWLSDCPECCAAFCLDALRAAYDAGTARATEPTP